MNAPTARKELYAQRSDRSQRTVRSRICYRRVRRSSLSPSRRRRKPLPLRLDPTELCASPLSRRPCMGGAEPLPPSSCVGLVSFPLFRATCFLPPRLHAPFRTHSAHVFLRPLVSSFRGTRVGQRGLTLSAPPRAGPLALGSSAIAFFFYRCSTWQFWSSLSSPLFLSSSYPNEPCGHASHFPAFPDPAPSTWQLSRHPRPPRCVSACFDRLVRHAVHALLCTDRHHSFVRVSPPSAARPPLPLPPFPLCMQACTWFPRSLPTSSPHPPPSSRTHAFDVCDRRHSLCPRPESRTSPRTTRAALRPPPIDAPRPPRVVRRRIRKLVTWDGCTPTCGCF